MKKILKTMLKILKWIGIVILGLIIILLIVRCVGKLYYNRTPDGGINETMYVDINGTKQWISIYGQDKDNPVLLYLHGGPCYPTVELDWSIFRKLSADYTVVEWDQRGCGHNYPDYAEDAMPTAETFMQDGLEMTDFLREHWARTR
jgi:pimeloyl-ACP methyl ester carboxylesterase